MQFKNHEHSGSIMYDYSTGSVNLIFIEGSDVVFWPRMFSHMQCDPVLSFYLHII